MKDKQPLIISGPCSAETEEQVLATAKALAATGKVDIMRAGVWKPRTKPGTFEGAGVEALPWLVKAREMTGLPLATEVANSKHVESALEYDIDVLWIGARTAANPFSMQEVAEALRGTKKMVYVKNPVNGEVDLWCGAVERLAACGINNLGLIHRGFSGFGAGKLRNAPMWHLALEMRRRMPDLPMICDPSHICGCRDFIPEITQQAADLDYDGLMIESHINPAEAWSDAKQQLEPEALEQMVRNVNWRKATVDCPEFQKSLNLYRDEIDQIDSELFELLGRRMDICEKIGTVKKENNVAILQSNRWGAIRDRILSQASKYNLSEEFLKTVLEAIHIESISRQNTVMNK